MLTQANSGVQGFISKAWQGLGMATASQTVAPAVAAPVLPQNELPLAGAPYTGTPSRNEKIKKASNHLRGSLAKELADLTKTDVSSASKELLKFHGIYQQQSREKGDTADNPTTFMIRARVPGGRLSVAQYKAFDDAAMKFGHGSIRLTTRQTIQFHWVAKTDVKGVMKELDSVLLSAQAACGDIVRNVTCAMNPFGDPVYDEAQAMAQEISDYFRSQAGGYEEIFLDAESKPNQEEPIYGDLYLPRKFKIAVTVAGDNSIDVHTNDMGLAATTGPDGKVDGYFFYAGGGHGRSHNAPTTFPRQSDCLGWIPKDKAMAVCEAIITTQRDFGGRVNRKQARLKYLMDAMGVQWFKDQVQTRAGISFADRSAPEWKVPDYLGWHQQKNGKWCLGVHTMSGRIQDRPGYFIRTALREIIEKYRLPTMLSADQDIVLLDINEKDKDAILKLFAKNHVDPMSPSKSHDRAMACVAFPTCGLAISESERVLASVAQSMDKSLKKVGLQNDAPVIRITGCPNGCARPYTAEIALVGQMPGDAANSAGYYQIFIAGAHNGARLNQLLVEKFPATKIEKLFDQMFGLWKANGIANETFGDFTARFDRKKLNDLLTVISEAGCSRIDSPPASGSPA